jgi:alcohol dehydrogenase (NADP+)
MVQVGAPEQPVSLIPFKLLTRRKRLTGSLIGSPDEISEMLQVAVDKNIEPWVEVRPMKDANRAIVDFAAGKARFRYVLAN